MCQLVKFIYDLKQVPKQWHVKFDQILLSNKYTINDSNKYIYSKSINTNTFVIMCLYVDDMLILSSTIGIIDGTKEMSASNFDMKDMEMANVILVIEIIKSYDGLMLSQEQYV